VTDGAPLNLDLVLRLADSPEKTAALAAWFQGLYAGEAAAPVLVGEGAVELYCSGSYSADGLDFVGEMPAQVARRLAEAGFVEAEEGAWVHAIAQVALELSGARLEPHQRVATLPAGGESVVRILSPEDTLVGFLAAWQLERSPLEAITAFQLWRHVAATIDAGHLEAAAARLGVEAALASLRAFAAPLNGRMPTFQELKTWAQAIPVALPV
jgi:hypothetical protein